MWESLGRPHYESVMSLKGETSGPYPKNILCCEDISERRSCTAENRRSTPKVAWWYGRRWCDRIDFPTQGEKV